MESPKNVVKKLFSLLPILVFLKKSSSNLKKDTDKEKADNVNKEELSKKFSLTTFRSLNKVTGYCDASAMVTYGVDDVPRVQHMFGCWP
ncbi:GSCOCT00014244001.2-RA-CDS [Cotesia congregata]|uniref:Cc_single_18.14 n=1 Tax=Cotesia congregata TaxID=51543 RepID=S6CVS9_COTCN|nr:GSCOCT00014244001.2-RA-CDS [Cotesia congregata]CAG5092564.1 cc_single_18.14 [Cotesia congregata]CCQ71280.1 hypothetical protein CcBV_18.14 [Cotesia congregata]